MFQFTCFPLGFFYLRFTGCKKNLRLTHSCSYCLFKPEEAAEKINLWIEGSTKGTVTSILLDGSIDQNTGLVLGSALYFRGRWLDRADIRATEVQKFCCLDGTCVEVPFVK
jgi:serine protease inhibitor